MSHGMQSPEYWVFEDLPTSRATVHRADCSFCNDGRGLRGVRREEQCRWLGPFSGLESAGDEARRTGRNNVHFCGRCCGPRK